VRPLAVLVPQASTGTSASRWTRTTTLILTISSPLLSPYLLSAGEHWDFSEQMDTYYNPIPHFTYKMALDHSPTLKNVPTLPRGGLDGLDGGIDAL